MLTDNHQTSKLTYLLLTYRQSILITVYSHLLCMLFYCPAKTKLMQLLFSAGSLISSMVAMDEHLLHPRALVRRAIREQRRHNQGVESRVVESPFQYA